MNWLLSCLVPLALFATWIEDTNNFGEQVKTELSDTTFLFSPLSLRTALLMAYLGASENTEQCMKKHLCIESDVLPPHLSLPNIDMACSTWLDALLTTEATFEEAVRGGFDYEVYKVPFLEKEKVSKCLDEWIKEKYGVTQETVSDINPLSRLHLAHTLLFSASWKIPFAKTETKEKPFFCNGKSTFVPMMHATLPLLYGENETCQVVAICFAQKESQALVITLPKKEKKAQTIDYQNLQECLVELELPRFTLQSNVDLKEVLTKMGMQDPFSKGASFAGIASHTPVYIGGITTNTAISIDENGASAKEASSTKLESVKKRGTVSMQVNRPFTFAIVDLENKLEIISGGVCAL